MLASLLGGSKPVRAQPIAGTVPEVDAVSVRVVVDGYQFAVAASKKMGSVDVQHFGWGLSKDKSPSSTLISEFGLSMHAESKRGGEIGNLLMDFGFTAEALNNNIDLLAVDPVGLDALVLSHGHYDHFGGVVGFLQQNKDKLKAKLPLYLGGEECFCSREWVGPPTPGNFGALDRQALKDANLTVTYAEGPSLVGEHAFTTGQIPLRSFEKVLSPSTMKIGVEDGIGCYPNKIPKDEKTTSIIPDQFGHELATAYNLKETWSCHSYRVQPPRCDQYDQAGPSRIRGYKGTRDYRRFPPRPLCRRLRAPNDCSAQRDGCRLRHSAALFGRSVLRTREIRNTN
jgi:7,8-dihydropterin-6-yl-methyl-4-(beta-D-ribofuranosyl)aminobenzene 5'-phosphate synthase